MSRLVTGAVALLGLLGIASGLWSWYRPLPPPTEIVKIKEVEKIKRVTVTVTKVVTIEKWQAVATLKLPDWVSLDSNLQVIAAGRVPPWGGQTEVTALLNTASGEGSLLQRQLRPPLFSLKATEEREIGLALLAQAKGEALIQLQGRWGLLRFGAVHLEAQAQADKDRQAAGASVIYRW